MMHCIKFFKKRCLRVFIIITQSSWGGVLCCSVICSALYFYQPSLLLAQTEEKPQSSINNKENTKENTKENNKENIKENINTSQENSADSSIEVEKAESSVKEASLQSYSKTPKNNLESPKKNVRSEFNNMNYQSKIQPRTSSRTSSRVLSNALSGGGFIDYVPDTHDIFLPAYQKLIETIYKESKDKKELDANSEEKSSESKYFMKNLLDQDTPMKRTFINLGILVLIILVIFFYRMRKR